MPTYVPRTEPVKKQEELAKREMELIFSIKKNATDKLIKAVDKYRQAQLSILKAHIHTFKENEFRKKPSNMKLEKLEKLTIEWANKSNEEIINEVKKSNNL